MLTITEASGSPCYVCGKPGVRVVNLSYTAASTVPSNMQSVCDEHTPPWFRKIGEQGEGEVCELRCVTFIDDAPRRSVDWTEDQQATGRALLSWGILDCAKTSRRGTTFLMVGDRIIRVTYEDVTDKLPQAQDVAIRAAIEKGRGT